MLLASRAFAVLLLVVACAPALADADTPDVASETERAEQRARARQAMLDDANDGGAMSPYGMRGLLSGGSGWLGTVVLLAVFYFIFVRGRGAGASWGSYYLFWIGVPVVLALVSSHPAILIVVIVGLVARRWLPDPFLILKHRGRVRSLEVDVATNPGNVTARRDLAKIWLEKHRPWRALPLLAEAIARDPDSLELLYLSGVSNLLAGRHERALSELLAVIHREPGFHYGEAYLRAADALIALQRWDDADDALERFGKIDSSSVEGRYKRVRVCKARKDADGTRRARDDLRDVWRTLPPFQRRKQLGWYVRSLFV